LNKTLNNKSNLPSSGDNNSTIVNLDNSLIVEILGINNENLDYCEKKIKVKILQKGNIIIINGNKKDNN
jgi:phosphate starvation-inducible protein PhoH